MPFVALEVLPHLTHTSYASLIHLSSHHLECLYLMKYRISIRRLYGMAHILVVYNVYSHPVVQKRPIWPLIES